MNKGDVSPKTYTGGRVTKSRYTGGRVTVGTCCEEAVVVVSGGVVFGVVSIVRQRRSLGPRPRPRHPPLLHNTVPVPVFEPAVKTPRHAETTLRAVKAGWPVRTRTHHRFRPFFSAQSLILLSRLSQRPRQGADQKGDSRRGSGDSRRDHAREHLHDCRRIRLRTAALLLVLGGAAGPRAVAFLLVLGGAPRADGSGVGRGGWLLGALQKGVPFLPHSRTFGGHGRGHARGFLDAGKKKLFVSTHREITTSL